METNRLSGSSRSSSRIGAFSGEGGARRRLTTREDTPQPRQSEQRRQRQRVAHHQQQVQRGGENKITTSSPKPALRLRAVMGCGSGTGTGYVGIMGLRLFEQVDRFQGFRVLRGRVPAPAARLPGLCPVRRCARMSVRSEDEGVGVSRVQRGHAGEAVNRFVELLQFPVTGSPGFSRSWSRWVLARAPPGRFLPLPRNASGLCNCHPGSVPRRGDTLKPGTGSWNR